MPLSDLQSDILRLLAAHRDPDSYVAGSTPLHREGPRYSKDIDIFHSRAERAETAAVADTAKLKQSGFDIVWLRQGPFMFSADVRRGDDAVRLEWVADSEFRFFPVRPDPLFGYMLHLADIATNKALAAAGRREPRDVLDLLFIHDRHLPAGNATAHHRLPDRPALSQAARPR